MPSLPVSSTESSFKPHNSGEYLRRNPDWHAEESAWKARHMSEMLARRNLQRGFPIRNCCREFGVRKCHSKIQ